MANIWEKAISILAGNSNLGRSYLITTVAETFFSVEIMTNSLSTCTSKKQGLRVLIKMLCVQFKGLWFLRQWSYFILLNTNGKLSSFPIKRIKSGKVAGSGITLFSSLFITYVRKNQKNQVTMKKLNCWCGHVA